MARIAERYKFRQRRLAELDELRRRYHGYGLQAVIDVIEEQMIIWERK